MIEMNVFSRDYIDSLYQDYQQDPASLPSEWQVFFETYDPTSEAVDIAQLPNGSNGVNSPAAIQSTGSGGWS